MWHTWDLCLCQAQELQLAANELMDKAEPMGLGLAAKLQAVTKLGETVRQRGQHLSGCGAAHEQGSWCHERPWLRGAWNQIPKKLAELLSARLFFNQFASDASAVEMDIWSARRALLSSLLPLLLRQRSLAEACFIFPWLLSDWQPRAWAVAPAPAPALAGLGLGIQVQVVTTGSLCFSRYQEEDVGSEKDYMTNCLTWVAHFHWVLGETKQKISIYLDTHAAACNGRWSCLRSSNQPFHAIGKQKLQSTVTCVCFSRELPPRIRLYCTIFHNLNEKDLHRK